MDFRLDENEQMIVDICRRFAKEQLAEAGAEADRQGASSAELIAKGLELGLFLDAVPDAVDGYLEGEYSHTQRVLRALELGSGCMAMALRYEANTETALLAAALGGDGEACLKALAEDPGQTLGCTVLPDIVHSASLEEDTLEGRIPAVPNAVGAAWYAVVSHPEAETPFVALVQAGNGVSVTADKTMGLCATAVGTVVFSSAKIAGALRGDDARSWSERLRAGFRITVGAAAVGAAARAIEAADAYAAERIQFGQPIGRFESLARMMHENRGRLDAARYLVLAAAQTLDHGEPVETLARHASDVAGETAVRAAIDAVQIHGGYGFVNDYPVEKIMRDVRVSTTLGGDGLRELVLAQARA